MNKEIQDLTRQSESLQAKEEQAKFLRSQIQRLSSLRVDIGKLEDKLAQLEAALKQGNLFNQVLDASRQYLEQTQPDHCPVCEQVIPDINKLLERLSSETPTDVAKLRKEHDALSLQLHQKQIQEQELVAQERLLLSLEADIAKFPDDLETQFSKKQSENDRLAQEISTVQIEISQIEGRIETSHRKSQTPGCCC